MSDNDIIIRIAAAAERAAEDESVHGTVALRRLAAELRAAIKAESAATVNAYAGASCSGFGRPALHPQPRKEGDAIASPDDSSRTRPQHVTSPAVDVVDKHLPRAYSVDRWDKQEPAPSVDCHNSHPTSAAEVGTLASLASASRTETENDSCHRNFTSGKTWSAAVTIRAQAALLTTAIEELWSALGGTALPSLSPTWETDRPRSTPSNAPITTVTMNQAIVDGQPCESKATTEAPITSLCPKGSPIPSLSGEESLEHDPAQFNADLFEDGLLNKLSAADSTATSTAGEPAPVYPLSSGFAKEMRRRDSTSTAGATAALVAGAAKLLTSDNPRGPWTDADIAAVVADEMAQPGDTAAPVDASEVVAFGPEPGTSVPWHVDQNGGAIPPIYSAQRPIGCGSACDNDLRAIVYRVNNWPALHAQATRIEALGSDCDDAVLLDGERAEATRKLAALTRAVIAAGCAVLDDGSVANRRAWAVAETLEQRINRVQEYRRDEQGKFEIALNLSIIAKHEQKERADKAEAQLRERDQQAEAELPECVQQFRANRRSYTVPEDGGSSLRHKVLDWLAEAPAASIARIGLRADVAKAVRSCDCDNEEWIDCSPCRAVSKSGSSASRCPCHEEEPQQ